VAFILFLFSKVIFLLSLSERLRHLLFYFISDLLLQHHVSNVFTSLIEAKYVSLLVGLIKIALSLPGMLNGDSYCYGTVMSRA
jgi:hypothetical protein